MWVHYGGQLSDKQKRQLFPYPVYSRYCIPLEGKRYWVWAYTKKQAEYLAKRRRYLKAGL